MSQNNRRFAGQTAPLGSDGIGRQVLYRCGECQRIWLQDARSVILDLQPAQLQHLATRLQADLAHLPDASCRFCRLKRGTGAFEVDEYAEGKGGYGFSWEMPQPMVTHLVCSVFSEQWMRKVDARAVRPDVPGNLPLLRQVLTWAKTCQPPRSVVLLDESLCAQQAADLRPGFGMAGTETWQFQGFVCSLPCPLFAGGSTLLSLLVAQPAGMPFDPTAAFALWQTLVEVTTQMGLPKAW